MIMSLTNIFGSVLLTISMLTLPVCFLTPIIFNNQFKNKLRIHKAKYLENLKMQSFNSKFTGFSYDDNV